MIKIDKMCLLRIYCQVLDRKMSPPLALADRPHSPVHVSSAGMIKQEELRKITPCLQLQDESAAISPSIHGNEKFKMHVHRQYLAFIIDQIIYHR